MSLATPQAPAEATGTDQKPVTLQGMILREEPDPTMRQALEFVGEDQVKLDAKDMASQADIADGLVRPGKDAVDYSDIQLTAEEDKMDVPLVPIQVTAKPADQDEMDFDSPEEAPAVPIEILPQTINALSRVVNGQRQIRHAELFQLAVEHEQDDGGWLPQQPSAPLEPVIQKLVIDMDDLAVFDRIPGRDKVEDTAAKTDARDDLAVSLPSWNIDQYAFPLVATKPQMKTYLDNFEPNVPREARKRTSLAAICFPAFSDSHPTSVRSASSTDFEEMDSVHLALPNGHGSVEDSVPTVQSPDSDVTEDYEIMPDLEALIHPVQNTPWELDIIWDEIEEEVPLPIIALPAASESQDGMNVDENVHGEVSDTESEHSEATRGTSKSGLRTSNLRGEYETPTGLMTVDDTILSESVYASITSLAFETSPLLPLSASEADPPATDFICVGTQISSSQFPVYNRRLDESDWLDRVVWDDTDQSQIRRLAPLHSKVEVDMTDIHILLEDEGTHYEEQTEGGNSTDSNMTGPVKKAIRKRHLQLKTKTTDVHRSKLDVLNQVDKFNLSRDAYYLDGIQARTREKKSIKLIHSPYALRKVLLRKSLSTQQYINFHRPKMHILVGVPHFIVPSSDLSRTRSRGLEVMKHSKDLSARDGRIVLFEFSEEFPPALSDIGMASRIANYTRSQDRSSDEAPVLAFLNSSENKDQSERRNVVSDDALPFEDGEEIVLDQTLDLPFLGDIQVGAKMQALHNNIFRAPIFRHLPEKSDFLMIRVHATGIDSSSLSSRRAISNLTAIQQQRLTTFYVREISALYLVGQQEPEQAIPAPGSRADNEYVKTRLEQYVYHLLALAQEDHGKAEVKLSTVQSYFPRTETATRKVLRKFTTFDRAGDGTWMFDPTEDRPNLPTEAEIEAMTSLDEACLFDCQQAVLIRLRGLGVPIQTDMTNFHRNVKSLYERNDPRFHIARFVAEELELAAWNLTSNFIDSAHFKSILQLTGLGDPSGKGQAYSYLRLPMKIANLKKDKEKEAGVVVTGTESDLRSLTLPQLDALLRQEGVKEEIIAKLKRWPKVHLLRDIANNRKKQEAEDSTDINKFARYSKHSVATHQDQYNDRIQQIFSSQIQALKYNPKADEEEAEETADLSSLLDFGGGSDAPAAGASSSSMDVDGAQSSHSESQEREETEAYLRFVNSLEVSRPGEESESQSTMSTRPGSPSANGNGSGTTVSRLSDDVIEIEPVSGLPKKPGKYAKITSTNSSGVEKVVWSLDPAKVAQAKEASSVAAKAATQAAKRAAKAASRAKKSSNPDAKPIKCGRCGQTGHNRNSSACPMYSESLLDDDEYTKKKKKKTASRGKKTKSDSEEEEEILEDDWIEEEEDDGDETPEEDFLEEEVGIAASRVARNRAPAVVATGTKLTIKGLSSGPPRRRAAAKRKRADFVDFDEDDEDEDFDVFSGFKDASPSPKKKPARQRIKPDSPQGELNTLLRGALDLVFTDPHFGVFKSKVDRVAVPDYYVVIKKPMYMDLISSRLRSFQYTSSQSFLADWDLLRANCRTYNRDSSPELLPVADDLYSRVASHVHSIGTDRLKLLEDAISATPSVPATPSQIQSPSGTDQEFDGLA
jgi:transcription initiation factor TFIID subunit 1